MHYNANIRQLRFGQDEHRVCRGDRSAPARCGRTERLRRLHTKMSLNGDRAAASRTGVVERNLVFRAGEAERSEPQAGSVEPLRPAPILEHDDPDSPSMFTAKAMLSLARQRKGLVQGEVPGICVLDPDGDLERHLHHRGELKDDETWGCFHTRLALRQGRDGDFGIIGRAVGAAFSVLLAEQLFASGCRFLISLSSAGQVTDLGPPPYFVVIDRALRDEGTSYHYLPPTRFAEADGRLLNRVLPSLMQTGVPLHVGASWTTDAPFRETEAKVAKRRSEGLLTVEMEAAGLYAFAAAQAKPVLCLAQVTNRLNCEPGDFIKGAAEGAEAALKLIAAAAASWEATPVAAEGLRAHAAEARVVGE